MTSPPPCYPAAVSFGLVAPAAFPLELREARDADARRVFRLCRAIGESGIELERPAPFEPGRPVELRFRLPGSPTPLALRAELTLLGEDEEQDGARGAMGLAFLALDAASRLAIGRYVLPRLGLPPPG